MTQTRVDIFTDGACSGNPGPGGWGAILRYGDKVKELSGGEAATTNNRMELTAAIEALGALREPCTVDLYTDSNYVRDGIKGWNFYLAFGMFRLASIMQGVYQRVLSGQVASNFAAVNQAPGMAQQAVAMLNDASLAEVS